jgi:hypothetical protein
MHLLGRKACTMRLQKAISLLEQEVTPA